MPKLIIGLVGLMASGKGTASKYYEKKYQATTFRFSTMLRDALDRFYLAHTRENMTLMSEILRKTYGEDLLAKTMAQDVENTEASIIIIDGVRRIEDIGLLKDMSNFILVEIIADSKTRYKHLSMRSENTDDYTKTYEQFIKDHELSTELTIEEVAKQANEVIMNNGNLSDFYIQLDNLIETYGN